MTEPDHGGVMRVSDADRERAIDRLKTAFADGMLARDEFETRVGLALTSRTRADLAAVTTDIPEPATQTPPPAERPQPQLPQPQRSPSVKKAFVVGGATLLGGFMAAADFGGGTQLAILLMFCLLVTGLATVVVAGIVKTILMLEARQARDSGSLPPSPGVQPDKRRPGRRSDGRASGPNSLAIGLR